MTESRCPLVGAIEAGGTTVVCAVGTGGGDIRAETAFATAGAEETLAAATAFFQETAAEHGELAAIGIASFGPVDRDPDSPGWGRITATPKPGWQNTDIAGAIGRALGVPVAFETDVAGAAIGEGLYGAARGLTDFAYITVGTGIGGGLVAGGRLLHGLVHPEIGHLPVRRRDASDSFEGSCPYHGACLEGLASGPAIAARWGRPPAELERDHPAWAFEADYLAELCATLTLTLSPQRILLGGGIMRQGHLFPALRARTRHLLGGYIAHARLQGDLSSYILPPGLGERAGIAGALAMARARAAGAATDCLPAMA